MPPLVPDAEIDRRLRGFQRLLGEAGIDVAIVAEASDLYYLTGTNQDAHLIVPADGEASYLVRRDLGRARDESPLARIEPLASLRELGPAVAAACGGPPRRVGLEFDVLTVDRYLRLARTFADAELVDCMPALRPLRAVKSPWELDRIRTAAGQVRAAHAALPGLLVEGMTDRDLQVELEYVLRRAGHQGPCRFRGMNGEMHYGEVLAGADAAVPAWADAPLGGPGPSPSVGRGPGGCRIEAGGAVCVDLVGAVDGYLADVTRTVWIGELEPTLARALDTCRAILAAVEPLLVPGTPWRVPYERGLELAREAGFGEAYMGAGASRVSFIGHGIGLDINEQPFLARGLDEPLVAGNVVAVEPKLVFPGLGAVGVEDCYLVRDGSPENLTA